MARPASKPKPTKSLEQTLWEAADKLRGNQEPSEYKHVVLGLVFLKYISDRFEERRQTLEAELTADGIKPERLASFLEDRDEYASHNVFWVPELARWSYIQSVAKLPDVGQQIDQAMDLIEKENPSVRGVLPRNYGRDGLDKRRLGELVDLIGSIGFTTTDDHGADDVLGRVYEYFLGQFAGKETGKDAGAFYTPRWVVKLLVEMLEPYKGRVYDPACGSGGMFVQSADFVTAHGGKRTDISVYGQEFTDTTWKLAKMNLALRGIEADLGPRSDDSFLADLHPDLRADYIIANPPFNVSDWWDAKLADDPRWNYGTPPQGNANFAWVQHFIHHLAPKGTAGFVLANGSLSSKTGGEGEIRRKLVEAGLVDCIVALPDKLFFNTGISVSLWFVSKGRDGNGHRERKDEVLFIDARKLGSMVNRRLRELTDGPDGDIQKIAGAYHAWRNRDGGYEDIAGFVKAASIEEVKQNDFILNPGRYVGTADSSDEDEPAEARLMRLSDELLTILERGHDLDKRIRQGIGGLRGGR
ncbi:SAM-dependent DNA methyltransferase [Microbacterium sp. CBA3102]|uniref:class I SAM-dependent DNA methyltransferase n=1 Tax=Microbacterium sp. CBA3102 TaxID=2603598 RepID=UPI0011BBDD7E|nr:class I SAM-dependent DNA methyltransferase [Microbacterium sp. CBA3102]QEA29485.1 SAM-dependent DNA methyltransferase [Microbacterium sp. CBA3102]